MVRNAWRRSPGKGAGSGDDVRSGLDLSGAVPAGGADEPAGRPAGAVFGPAADGQRGEHDRQAGLDGVALAVGDGPGLQVALGHPERFPGPEQLVAGAGHEPGRDRGAIGADGRAGEVAPDPGQGPGPGLKVAAARAGAAREPAEPGPPDQTCPATAVPAFLTCSPVPRSALLARSLRYWQQMTWSRRLSSGAQAAASGSSRSQRPPGTA